MKFIKIVTLTLALNGIALPLQSMQGELTTAIIQPINEQRVQHAREAYERETQWAPFFHYATVGTKMAAVGIGLYYTISTFRDAHRYDDMKALIEASKLHVQKNSEALTELYKNMVWYNTVLNVTKTSLALAIPQILVQYATGSLNTSLDYCTRNVLPLKANLSNYISARTDLERNLSDLQRYLKNHTLFQDEINGVIQAVVFDVEKIVGYLQHFKSNGLSASASRQHEVCQRYINNITLITNNLVLETNADKPLPIIIENFGLLVSEIQSAKVFVDARYR